MLWKGYIYQYANKAVLLKMAFRKENRNSHHRKIEDQNRFVSDVVFQSKIPKLELYSPTAVQNVLSI